MSGEPGGGGLAPATFSSRVRVILGDTLVTSTNSPRATCRREMSASPSSSRLSSSGSKPSGYLHRCTSCSSACSSTDPSATPAGCPAQLPVPSELPCFFGTPAPPAEARQKAITASHRGISAYAVP